MFYKVSAFVVFVSALLFSACTPQQAAGLPVNRSGLTEALEADGAQLEIGEKVSQDFFAVEGQIVKLNGADLQVFEYTSEEAMQEDAALVAADGGSIGTSMVTWMASPHFYQSGKIIVLYVGDDSAILDRLNGVFGEQFAGR